MEKGVSVIEPQALLRQAFANFEKGNLGEAEKLCRTLLSAKGEATLAESLLAFIAHKSGRSEEGEAQLRRLMARADLPSHAPYLLALLLLERGAIADARPFLEQTVTIEPLHLPAWLALGETAKRLGERNLAAKALGKAAVLAPQDQKIQLTYAFALAESGAFKEAEEIFLKIAENNPALSMAHYGAGLLAQQRGAADQARELYQRAIDTNPNHLKALNNLGTLQQESGELDEAVETLSKAVRLDPNYGGARFNLGNALLAAKRFSAAEEAFRQAIDLMPGFARGHTNLGAALLGQMRIEEAEAALHKGLALDPNDVEALHNLGNALSYKEDYPAALEFFRAATAGMPGEPKFRFGLASALIKNGQADEALQEIDASLQEDPASTQALSLKSACLAVLDRGEEERYLVDRDHLLQFRRIEDWDPNLGGFESLAALNQALAEHVSTHPTLRKDKTTVHGFDTDEILSGDKPEVMVLRNFIHDTARLVMETLRVGADHPFALGRPADYRFKAWGVRMWRQGFQVPHIHHNAWLSGVYYVKLPSAVTEGAKAGKEEGWIEFGRGEEKLFKAANSRVQRVQPKEGLLLSFPSYFWHRTIPFVSDEDRISIAFDVIPEDG